MTRPTEPMDPKFTARVTAMLLGEMKEFLQIYRQREGLKTDYWKDPLLAFADAGHPYLRGLRTLISPTHLMPEEILPNPTVVLCYFVPFREEIGTGNIGGVEPSALWAETYRNTNEMFLRMNEHLQKRIESWGYRAATPEGIGTLGPDRIYSNWSQRHLAYAAGLGTFGMNNMLITYLGCCGRLFSLVTDLPVRPGAPLERENCLFRRSGACGLCIKRCPAGALSAKEPFDRQACYRQVRLHGETLGENVCGKCVVGMPCTFHAP